MQCTFLPVESAARQRASQMYVAIELRLPLQDPFLLGMCVWEGARRSKMSAFELGRKPV